MICQSMKLDGKNMQQTYTRSSIAGLTYMSRLPVNFSVHIKYLQFIYVQNISYYITHVGLTAV